MATIKNLFWACLILGLICVFTWETMGWIFETLPIKEYALKEMPAHYDFIDDVSFSVAGRELRTRVNREKVMVVARGDGQSLTTVKFGFVVHRTATLLVPAEDVQLWEGQLEKWRSERKEYLDEQERKSVPRRVVPTPR